MTVTGVVMKPSFCSSEIADGSKVMSRSTKETCSCERYSFTFVQNIQPGWLNTVTLLPIGPPFSLSQPPYRPQQNRRERGGENAIKAEAPEIRHVADTQKVRQRCQRSQNQQRNPNPEFLYGAQQQQDHRHVENDRNVSVRDAKGLCEGRIGYCFATPIEYPAPKTPYSSALVEPHVEHGCSAGGSKAHPEEAIRRKC